MTGLHDIDKSVSAPGYIGHVGFLKKKQAHDLSFVSKTESGSISYRYMICHLLGTNWMEGNIAYYVTVKE